MAGDALFVGWGQVVRGREQLALQVFQETIAFYTKLQEDGRIASFDATLLAPHGGDLAGFLLMHGERSSLDSIRASEEFYEGSKTLIFARRRGEFPQEVRQNTPALESILRPLRL